jgi:hypothetical protein
MSTDPLAIDVVVLPNMAFSVVAGLCRVSTVTHSMTVAPSGCGVQNGEDERRQ